MATDRERLIQQQIGQHGASPNISSIDEAVKATHRRTIRLQKLTVDPAAGDATTNGVGNGTFCVHATLYRKSKLVAARLIATTDTNTTEHASNFATINVTKCNGAGGSNTVVLSKNTAPTANGGMGNIAKVSLGTPTSLTSGIVASAAECDAGSHLMLQIAKAASGVAVNPFVLELDFEEC